MRGSGSSLAVSRWTGSDPRTDGSLHRPTTALVRELDPRVSGWATIDGHRAGFAEGTEVVGPRILHALVLSG